MRRVRQRAAQLRRRLLLRRRRPAPMGPGAGRALAVAAVRLAGSRGLGVPVAQHWRPGPAPAHAREPGRRHAARPRERRARPVVDVQRGARRKRGPGVWADHRERVLHCRRGRGRHDACGPGLQSKPAVLSARAVLLRSDGRAGGGRGAAQEADAVACGVHGCSIHGVRRNRCRDDICGGAMRPGAPGGRTGARAGMPPRRICRRAARAHARAGRGRGLGRQRRAGESAGTPLDHRPRRADPGQLSAAAPQVAPG
ncbi:hypothetical protein IWQ56_006135, partial [Coemansia nantahalensis]